MSQYIATFYTHFGAVKFSSHCKKNGISARPMPVPRALSSSCGTCVRFEADSPAIPQDQDDLEGCYLVLEDGAYRPVPLDQLNSH